MLLSEGELALVQNEIGFQHLVFQRGNSSCCKMTFDVFKVFQLPKSETLHKDSHKLLLQKAGHSLILKPYCVLVQSPHTEHKASHSVLAIGTVIHILSYLRILYKYLQIHVYIYI